MDDDPCRLVYDQQVLVLIGDPELAFLRLQGNCLPLDDLHLEQFAALEPGTLRPRGAVHPDRSGREQALCFAARRDLVQTRNEPVEPFAGRFGRHLKAD